MRGRHHPVVLLRDQRHPLAHPRVDDVLARLALQAAQQRGDRHSDARHHRLRVCIDKLGELFPVPTAK
jgi:hypothetical protein